jgi:hypothetical protein
MWVAWIVSTTTALNLTKGATGNSLADAQIRLTSKMRR